MKKIVVVGSLNMDHVIEVPHMPECGETLSGRSVALVPGGKGANQAYAIGKLGGNVTMIGAIGRDTSGEALLNNLKCVGVNVEGIAQIDGGITGQAFITVDDNGDNAIVIIAGTNGMVTKELIDENVHIIRESDIVIVQLEIPLDVVAYVKEIAVKEGRTVIVDPAPAVADIPDCFWKGIDYIKPNETELAILTGLRLETREELVKGARMMLKRGVKNVIVTLGGDGCLLVKEEGEQFFPSHKVKAVDTTAAGDSFTAAFALALSRGKKDEEAIEFGQEVSSIAVTRKGAQASIPTIAEVEEMRKEKKEETAWRK